MKHRVPHDLDLELAKQASTRAIEAYTKQFENFNPQSRWESEHRAAISFSAKGITLKGTLSVLPDAIEVDLSVPFMLRVFTNQAVPIIEREIRTWILKAKKGEL